MKKMSSVLPVGANSAALEEAKPSPLCQLSGIEAQRAAMAGCAGLPFG